MHFKISNKKQQLTLGLFLLSQKLNITDSSEEAGLDINKPMQDILYFALYIKKQHKIYHFQLFNNENLAKQLALNVKNILHQQKLALSFSKDIKLVSSLDFNCFWQKSYFNQQRLKYDDLKQQISAKIERELGLNSALISYDFSQRAELDFYRINLLVAQKQQINSYLARLNNLKIDQIDSFTATVFRGFSEKLRNLNQLSSIEQKLFIYQDSQHFLALFYADDLQVINLKLNPDLTQLKRTYQPQQLYLYAIKLAEFQSLCGVDCSDLSVVEIDFDDYFLADGCALVDDNKIGSIFNYFGLNVLDWRASILAKRLVKTIFIGAMVIIFSLALLLFFINKNQSLTQINQRDNQQLIKLEKLAQQQKTTIASLKKDLEQAVRTTGIKAEYWRKLIELFSNLGDFGFLLELNLSLQQQQQKPTYIELLVVGEANSQASFERVYTYLKNAKLIQKIEVIHLAESKIENYISFELSLKSSQFTLK